MATDGKACLLDLSEKVHMEAKGKQSGSSKNI
jgi:hypothetical protein